jgi:hypothetical protein
MKRMASTLETQRLQVLEAIETDAADTLQTVILTGELNVGRLETETDEGA